MTYTRIAFNDTATYSGAYYLILNPSKLELNSSEACSRKDILDGAKVKQSAYFDSRPYVLQWANIPSNYSGFPTMLNVLVSYKNHVKYVNFGSVDYAFPTLGWTKVRVDDVKVEPPTGGKIKYNVEILLNPEV